MGKEFELAHVGDDGKWNIEWKRGDRKLLESEEGGN